MRWGALALILLATLIAQKSVVWIAGATVVDLFLALALLCGLCGPTLDARIAGWVIGLTQDLGSSADAIGSNALALGACVLVLTWVRDAAQTRVWWGRLAAAFVAAWPAQVFVALYDAYWLGHGGASLLGLVGRAALVSAIAAGIAVMLIAAQPLLVSRRGRGSRALRA